MLSNHLSSKRRMATKVEAGYRQPCPRGPCPVPRRVSVGVNFCGSIGRPLLSGDQPNGRRRNCDSDMDGDGKTTSTDQKFVPISVRRDGKKRPPSESLVSAPAPTIVPLPVSDKDGWQLPTTACGGKERRRTMAMTNDPSRSAQGRRALKRR